jgi:Family of unknown function (DUF6152)
MKAGAFTAAIVFCAAVLVAAHHGQVGLFDDSRIVELKGTVKQWSFINPHPILVLEAPDEKGVRKDWDVYFGPGAVPSLRRQGFAADTFKVGETVVVKGHPAASGAPGMDVMGKGTGVTRADGRSVP